MPTIYRQSFLTEGSLAVRVEREGEMELISERWNERGCSLPKGEVELSLEKSALWVRVIGVGECDCMIE